MKRIISVILALAVSACICAPFSAAAPQKVKSLHPEFAAKLSSVELSGRRVPLSSLQNLSAQPGGELEIVLAGKGSDVDLFLDQAGRPVNTADVTVSKMRATGVAAEVYAETGGDLIESVDIGVKNAGTPAAKPVLRVGFAPDFRGFEPESFALRVYISIGGVRQEQSEMIIAGTLGRPEVLVDSTFAAVYAEGCVVAAQEDIAYIELQAGYGVTVTASLKQGGRYRVQAMTGDDPDDLEDMEKDSAIVDVIKLDTAGFEIGDISGVRIECEGSLEAYDRDGAFLGETTRALPFRGKYYLSRPDGQPDITGITKPLS